MIEDFSKIRPKRKENVQQEIEKYQSENEQLIGTLSNFKDTHSEMGVIIEEIMKI